MVIRGLGSLNEHEGILLHGKILPLELQHELVLGPGATSELLLPAPDGPRAPLALPGLSQGDKGAFPWQGGGRQQSLLHGGVVS